MFLDNAMERINRLILQGGRTGMTENQFFAAEIKEWKNSQRRKDQVMGDLYYEGQHDILQRQRTIIGENGQLQVVTNLPNNRLIDNQYALMVDQKTNYLVGKPFTLNCQDKGYTDALGKVFNKRFYRLLKYVCEDALNGGLGWIYPYYNEAGELAFKHFPAYDIFLFGLTMITPFLIVRFVTTPKKCGTATRRKRWRRWKSSKPMAFTGISIKMIC